MKKLFLVVLIAGWVSQLFAQDSTNVKHKHKTHIAAVEDTSSTAINYRLYNYTANTINSAFNQDLRPGANNNINIDFDFYANSNSIPASFAYNLLFNRSITDALKDRADKQIKNILKFEESINTGATYRHHFDKWDGDLIIGYHFRQLINLTAPKQAFEAAFYGNGRFEGDTANLSNITFQYNNYNQYSIGIRKKVDYGKYQMELGVSGSFLQVINNQDIHTRDNTWLYTAPDGEYLALKYDITYNAALSGAPSFTGLPGVGASGDFHIGFMNKDKWKITFDLSDLGVMAFRKTPVNYSGANYVEFHGITIPDLTTFSSQTFDTLNLDSAVRANLPVKSNNSYTVFMPFNAQIIFSKPLLHDKLVLSAGLQYRHLPGYKAYGFAKLNYFIKPDMIFSTTLGGGGYSTFNLGVEFAKSWKYFDFAIGSSNLIGLLAPPAYPGSGFYLRLAGNF
ncbi:MAG: hypothetical protein JWQ57_3103 [Mucilaginibacter sp.]|nr:hypothetical protein [Mucilaginibacter sp.]